MSRIIAVFFHVTSGMGVFCALGMEGIALYQYRRASGAAQIEGALRGYEVSHRAAPLTGAATILSGVYLAQTVWGWRAAWINIALAGVLLVAVISAVTAASQLARMRAGGPPHEPVFGTSFTTRTGLLMGILFLMTVKPPFDVSLIAAAIGAGVGFLAGVRPFKARAQASAVQ
jgi:hypothetical protein